MSIRKIRALPTVVALLAAALACSPGGLTSEQAQSLLNERLPEGNAEVLGVRQVDAGEAVARVRLSQAEGAEVDVAFSRFDTGWRPDGTITLAGQSLPFSQLTTAVDRGRQRRTMADMRNIATANGTMRVDTGRYASSLAELAEGGYMQVVPPTDAWGTPWNYVASRETYTLTSLGSDGAAGPAPPRSWPDAPYDPDIVLRNGQFIQAPTGR